MLGLPGAGRRRTAAHRARAASDARLGSLPCTTRWRARRSGCYHRLLSQPLRSPCTAGHTTQCIRYIRAGTTDAASSGQHGGSRRRVKQARSRCMRLAGEACWGGKQVRGRRIDSQKGHSCSCRGMSAHPCHVIEPPAGAHAAGAAGAAGGTRLPWDRRRQAGGRPGGAGRRRRQSPHQQVEVVQLVGVALDLALDLGGVHPAGRGGTVLVMRSWGSPGGSAQACSRGAAGDPRAAARPPQRSAPGHKVLHVAGD